MNGQYDERLAFGEYELKNGTGELPNVLVAPIPDYLAGTVDIRCIEAAVGGTSITAALQGSNGDGSWQEVVKGSSIPAADLVLEAGKKPLQTLTIPEEYEYTHLRIAITAAGTFSAGKIDAYVNTYRGV